MAAGLGAAPQAALAQPSEAEAEAGTPTAGAPLAEATKAQKFQAKQYLKAGQEDFDRKLFDRALVALRQSYGIVKSPGTRLRIVRSLVELERFVDAHREAVLGRLEAEAAAAADPQFTRVVQQYDATLEELRPQVALVKVELPVGASDGASVTIDGEPLAAELWAQPFAVAPGRHQVAVTRAGKTVPTEVEAVVGQTQSVAPVGAEAVLAEEQATAVAPPPPREPVEEERRAYDGPDRVTLGVAAAGLGVIGFVNFGIFGMLSNGQLTRLEDACPDRRCDPGLQREADVGATYNALANVGLTVGLVGVAAGAGLIVWDLLDPAAPGAASGPGVTEVAVGPGTISVTGQF